MRRLTTILALAVSVAAASPAVAQGIEGSWLMQNRKAEVDIRPCGPALCGRISRIMVYPKDGARTDIHNGNASLRRRPLVGLPVLLDFRRVGGEFRGRVYDPKSGGTYGATLTPNGPGRITLKACVLFVCKTQEWSRVR